MEFACPACGKLLNGNYVATKPILEHHHPQGKCPDGGIGQVGVKVKLMSKNQAKTNARVQGEAKAQVHKDTTSARNANLYQTPHHNPAVQAQRVQAAVNNGLGGHASQNSNFKPNNNTTTGLKKINK
jgi:hypothetical protein